MPALLDPERSEQEKEAAEVASEPFKVPGKTAQVVLPDTILNGQDGRRRLVGLHHHYGQAHG